MEKKSKIALIAGGTGGHIFPAISLLEKLVEDKKEVIFFSDQRVKKIINLNKKLFFRRNVQFYIINISRNFSFFINFFKNFFNILNLIRRNNPRVIIAFGGYTSIPFLIISKILLKTIILHEQNIVLGKANKFFLPFSKKIIFGLGNKNKSNNKNFFYIRNPVRKKVITLRKKYKFVWQKKIIILISGGSQGASIFDHVIPQSLNLLPDITKKKIQVYHQCSKKNLNFVKDNYKKFKIKFTCKPFFRNFPDIMNKSQFVISRSGASTLSEIITLGKPSILIPYKFAKNNHQEKNARWIVSKGAGVLMLEGELSVEKLKEKIANFIIDKKNLRKMSKNSFSLGDNDSISKITKLIY